MPRHSAAVYRRRRLAVLLGLILVLAIVGASVWLLIARPWASTGAQEPAPAPTSSASPGPTPSGSASPAPSPSADATPAVVPCEAKDIEVTAVTDAESYPDGALPKLSISLTNKGTRDCTIDVGSTTQVFTISSGSDEWWRSTDCQENPSSMIATLTAGSTVVSKEPVVWDRTRSSVETCAQENRQRAPGGGASYHVGVSIGGFPSATTTQFLLF
ncbi:hypothetical protein M4D51_12905 [Microbacterium sp. p3-SID338]|uniref:hypothetical protein n=1 Tax=unclassified Microbacterium TaxID=2609290 RepID=UPI000C806B62|nr:MULTISPECIES: hypothetical protein [unclassified Microbacterium]MCT1396625.1 hypothetical protein [Microbacterium sp. p3-SID338]PMC02797.1 hypothetical protein CJ226_12310 [Microbacterium sp. UMB0228]